MNLPFFKRFNKKVVPLYYLVLVLRDEKAEAVIFEEIENRIKIIGQKEEHFSTSIDEISQEELLEKLDKAISQAESSLPENIQTQKTIFGIKDSWADNDQIKKEYLAKLKKTSEELGLIPIGFLVMSQAISHLLQKEEGAPVSAILAEINKKSVTVTLLRAGKSIETKSSEIHESIPFTVDTVLKHFDVPEILPSRIIVFNGKEDLSQEFISHTWSKSLPFLHLPQITNLPVGFDAKSVLFGAATQMGFEVLEKDMPSPPKLRLGAAGGPKKSSMSHEESEKEEIENIALKPDQVSEEIADEKNLTQTPKLYKDLETENFGFAKDVDVAKMPIPQSLEEVEEPQEPIEAVEKIEEKEPARHALQGDAGGEVHTENRSPKKFNSILMIAKNIVITILSLIFAIVGKIKKGKLSIVISAILVLIVALIASYFLFLKATVTISVDPKITQQERSVLFSTTKTTNPTQNIIKGEFVSVSEDGSVSTAATGKKDVGTPAKGTVTIFNSLSQSKTLTEGTILKSSNGLEFTLDSSVTIKAVASHSADETVAPEKITANVTADQLGKESNLPSGTKFSVGSFDASDLVAKNDNPFSGGTKKEVTVVSKNDSIKLENDLLKQLENKAKEDLQKQLNQNKILLPSLVTETLGKKSLSAKVGDETNQVTLTGTVEYQGISYDKNDLVTLSKALLSKDIPSNQEIDYNNVKISVLDIKNKNDEEIEANLNIKALLLPKIDQIKLIKDIKGRSFKNAQDLLYKVSQVTNVDIKLSPNLIFLPKNLPAKEKNIRILIKIDE